MNCQDLETLTWLANSFITCTLKDPSPRQIALSVQQHKNFPHSTVKRGDLTEGLVYLGFLAPGLLFKCLQRKNSRKKKYREI